MHNKSMTSDGQATIIGGRNIGDEYFSAREDVNFGDLDVLAVGPVVKQVSTSFDLYWNGPHAYPITALVKTDPTTPQQVSEGRARLVQEVESKRGSAYYQALKESKLAKALSEQKSPDFFWGQATAVYDDPDKITKSAKDSKSGVTAGLKDVVAQAREEIFIVSPYFVPGKEGVAKFAEWRKRGLRVIVLTNSLAATDVGSVHAGYAHYREDLLKLGVELYELKPNRSAAEKEEGKDQEKEKSAGGFGSSRASLHAKTFYFDRKHLFIGSLNLDPRSVVLNTEIGILAENEPMARGLAEGLDRVIRENTYRLERQDNSLRWVTKENGVETTYTGEPLVSGWRRFSVFLLSLLPIEGQL
jgi:putative cardiolipin synthase